MSVNYDFTSLRSLCKPQLVVVAYFNKHENSMFNEEAITLYDSSGFDV